MILALLLQITLFDQYTKEAARLIGVNGVTTEGGVVSYNRARNLAWINGCDHPQGYGCGSTTVFIAYDVARTAPADVLQYLAYHEVCHLKLGHSLYAVQDINVAHNQVSACMQRALGSLVQLKLKAAYEIYKPYINKLRKAQFGPNCLQ